MRVLENYTGVEKKKLDIFSEKDINRFWDSVDKSNIFGCWLWQRIKNRQGYGVFRISGGSRNLKIWYIASRVAYYFHTKIDPCELSVLHTCDNPTCCNPAHLFLGTHDDNIKDMMRKGRKADRKGEKNTGAKLTLEKVLEIRNKFTPENNNRLILAKEYGVSKDAISSIVKRKNWQHI